MKPERCRLCGLESAGEERCPSCARPLIPAVGETYRKALAAFEEGDFAAAAGLWRREARRHPGDPYLQRDIGHAFFHLKHYEEALHFYKEALRLEDSLTDAHFNRGLIYVEQGRINDALVDFLEVLSGLHPIQAGTYYLGLFYTREIFEVQCRMNAAHLFKERGELEKAAAQYEWILKLDAGNPVAWAGFGDVALALERFDQAVQAYRRALKGLREGDERRVELWNDLGIAYHRQGKSRFAAEAFRRVLEEKPDHANAAFNLAQIYRGDPTDVYLRRDLREILKWGKDKAYPALLTLATSLKGGDISSFPETRDSGGELLIGESPAMRRIKELLKRAAASDATVLILGENGTGKELAARTIHQQSARFDRPFVPIACSTIPETLLESELFGHERGAFTGAVGRRIGRLESASGGTVFLDEIGEIPLPLQVKLLRVLQEKCFERVGGNETIRVDLRILAATNRDLKKAIQTMEFREDLYYRLNVIEVVLPPLREREGDLPLLIRHFLEEHRRKKRTAFEDISASALRLLERYPFPGNVRELENMIERIVVLHRGKEIRPEHLPPEIQEQSGAAAKPPTVARPPLPAAGILGALEQAEREAIREALRQARFNKCEAARRLGISRPTLYQRIRKYRLDQEEIVK